MENWKKRNVVLLSTDRGTIWTNQDTGKLNHTPHYISRADPKEIYIISDEEIKKGEWMLNLIGNPDKEHTYEVIKAKHDYAGKGNCWEEKIIATTNSELTFSIKGTLGCVGEIPKISEFSIKQYCNSPVNEVLVEYESYCKYGDNCPSKGAYNKQHLCDIDYKLKVNPDNTINIKPIKECWNREEIVKALNNPYGQGSINRDEYRMRVMKELDL